MEFPNISDCTDVLLHNDVISKVMRASTSLQPNSKGIGAALHCIARICLQGERLLQPLAAQPQHPVKAVVQTGERPDFERTTSSGIPARPGPITSGMPKPRLDFRVSSGFLDASALTNDSQARSPPGQSLVHIHCCRARRLTCMPSACPRPLPPPWLHLRSNSSRHACALG